MLLLPVLIVAADIAQEAMHKFLDSKGDLMKNSYYPEDTENQHVRVYKNHNFFGPNLNGPCICQSQLFKGK